MRSPIQLAPEETGRRQRLRLLRRPPVGRQGGGIRGLRERGLADPDLAASTLGGMAAQVEFDEAAATPTRLWAQAIGRRQDGPASTSDTP
ncbi:hypothetical protein [Amycolatopsis sp. H20-H5]|uniref:hypothetical protein n=1 Tax=Amycolatopsis sp. H20-H5 TaxID=3046309 RepID=UPI002DBC813B|nr:hypothetical protein [Amycolatopsis sp. H20-H5]MEC3981798.1 hypothetical protein [Amycolatopsis sp. H20-H5]